MLHIGDTVLVSAYNFYDTSERLHMHDVSDVPGIITGIYNPALVTECLVIEQEVQRVGCTVCRNLILDNVYTYKISCHPNHIIPQPCVPYWNTYIALLGLAGKLSYLDESQAEKLPVAIFEAGIAYQYQVEAHLNKYKAQIEAERVVDYHK